MAESEPNAQQTLAVIIGASRFERAPKLAEGRAFNNSAQDFFEYLRASDGLGLPRENIEWRFDDTRSPSDQLGEIGNFLERRSAALEAKGVAAQDLIVYYIGHGLFWGPDNAYCLAVRATDEKNEGLTSIRVRDLASIIRDNARWLRRFLIFDCCFSGAAQKEFQASALQTARVKVLDELPARGTALLCSASAQDPSLAPVGLQRTMFSDALLKVLYQGHSSLGARLSVSELGDLIKTNLKGAYPDNWVRPEVHSPDQREGNVASVHIFPNVAFPGLIGDERLKDEEKRRAEEQERAETERRAQEQADREAADREAKRLAAEAAEAERKALAEAEEQKRAKAERRRAQEEAEEKRRAQEQAERDAAERKAKRLAAQEGEAERKARAQAEERERARAEQLKAEKEAEGRRRAEERAEGGPRERHAAKQGGTGGEKTVVSPLAGAIAQDPARVAAERMEAEAKSREREEREKRQRNRKVALAGLAVLGVFALVVFLSHRPGQVSPSVDKGQSSGEQTSQAQPQPTNPGEAPSTSQVATDNAADASKVNSAAPKDRSTQPTQGETAPAETNKAGIANGLERYYLGRHNLRVNRVGDSVKVGSVRITNTDGTLRLAGSVSSGAYSLELSGTVQPISQRKFFLNGEISGIPDLSWKNVAPTRLQTLGQFMFEATQGRRYWRMYQVNGRDCVCDDNCGNDFCYIDIEFLP